MRACGAGDAGGAESTRACQRATDGGDEQPLCRGRLHAAAAYRREIEAAPDPDAKRAEIEARLNAIASPFRTAEATGQDIIDPRHTRRKLVQFVRDAQRILERQVGVPWIPYSP